MGWDDFEVHLEQQETLGKVQDTTIGKGEGRESPTMPTGLLLRCPIETFSVLVCTKL